MENEKSKFVESETQSLHKRYWGFVYKSFESFLLQHKKSFLLGGLALIFLLFTYMGYLRYSPEFSLPIGTFKAVETIRSTEKGESETAKSNVLDRSIFNLSKEISAGDMTSKERVDFIARISGLKTKDESGTIDDIGTDGLTLLIRGNSEDGRVGLIQCDFSAAWKQRISLLKKGSEIKFYGTITEYDLGRGWIVINDCQLDG